MANRNLFFPHHLRSDWKGSAGDMLIALGLKAGGHLPPEGMPSRLVRAYRRIAVDAIGVEDIKVWVTPAGPTPVKNANGFTFHTAKHRVMCACPDCGAEMSAGRLAQHVCNNDTATDYREARGF